MVRKCDDYVAASWFGGRLPCQEINMVIQCYVIGNLVRNVETYEIIVFRWDGPSWGSTAEDTKESGP